MHVILLLDLILTLLSNTRGPGCGYKELPRLIPGILIMVTENYELFC
jgi:hypothetical protein